MDEESHYPVFGLKDISFYQYILNGLYVSIPNRSFNSL
jgi:hypothetical protein